MKIIIKMSIEQMHEELNKIGFMFESGMTTNESNPIIACENLIQYMIKQRPALNSSDLEKLSHCGRY